MNAGKNGNGNLSAEQLIQEAEYQFPYHYIPTFENGNFSPVRKLRWAHEYLSYLRFILDRLAEIEFDSLLDVGCGEGRFVREAKMRFPGKDLAGIDFSERAVRYAQLFNPQAQFVCGDISNGSLFERQFDVITLIETLEHVPLPDVAGFIRSLRRHLKPDGFLVITVPSENLNLAPKHYQHFSLSSLAVTLQDEFTIADCYFLNRISRWEKIVQTFVSNRLFILNERRILNAFYHYYESSLLNARESDAKRICAVCRPK
jgi:SAM-dependent methyltransferase